MKKCFLSIVFILGISSQGFTEEKAKPTIQDLDFLIGTWEIEAKYYDPHHPEKGVVSTEVGVRTCRYDIEYNNVPMFIICDSKMKSSRGTERTYRHSIRYNRFINAYSFVGMFGNWPSNADGTLFFYLKNNTLEVRSELMVRDLLERNVDIFRFDESYSSYELEGLANFSDMPMTMFNLVNKEIGKKIK